MNAEQTQLNDEEGTKRRSGPVAKETDREIKRNQTGKKKEPDGKKKNAAARQGLRTRKTADDAEMRNEICGGGLAVPPDRGPCFESKSR